MQRSTLRVVIDIWTYFSSVRLEVIKHDKYVQVFFIGCLYIPLEIQLSREENWDIINGYKHSPLHIFVLVPSQDLDSNVIWRVVFVLWDIVRFVDIGGIVDNHYSNFLWEFNQRSTTLDATTPTISPQMQNLTF
jgi:hypothetical protein